MRQILFLVSLSLLVGCSTLNPFQGLSSPPQAPHKMGTWEQTSKPVFMGTDYQGRAIVGNEITYRASASETLPNLTLGQRIGRWFSGLSLAGLAFVIISIIFFSGTPILWIWAKFLKARSALKKTVAGIEELNSADQDKVKEELAKTHDTGDKRYIAQIKAEIKKDEVVK